MIELSIPHQVKPRNRYTGSQNQPDIVSFDSSYCSIIELDISMAHPHSCDALKRADTKSGYDCTIAYDSSIGNFEMFSSISEPFLDGR